MTTRRQLVIVIVGVFGGMLLIVAIFLLPAYIEDWRFRNRLLHHTDHKALLAACRDLSARVKAGEMRPGEYRIRRNTTPEAAAFPQIIRDLAPNYAVVESERVVLEMMGGFYHFGVIAYPESVNESRYPGFHFGDRKLLDGLWYYDDNYEEAH